MRGSLLRSQTQPQPPNLAQSNQLFWTYSIPTQEDLDQLEIYFTQYTSTGGLQQLIPAVSIIEAYQSVCRLLKIQMHPLLQQIPQNIPKPTSLIGAENSIESIKGPGEQLQYLILQNHLIDLFTLKLLTYLWPNFTNLQVLKIFNSQLNEQELNQLAQMNLKLKISKFFLEYIHGDITPFISQMYQLSNQYNLSGNSTQLVQLYLRSNGLDNIAVVTLFKTMKSNQNCSLKLIELSSNNISRQGIRAIGDYLSQQNQLEYIGLAKNNIQQWDDLKSICEQLVRKKMSPEDMQAYKELEEKRENQIKLRAKKKTQEHEPLIQLDPIIQGPDGFNYIAKNQQMKVLNVAANGISDNDKDQIEKFIGLMGENFQLVLLGCNIDSKIKEKLKKKSKNIIV